jgi:MFS family permease
LIRDYLRLIAEYPRFLTFGGLHFFFSSPGQSYSLGVFGPAISAAFLLGSTEFGLLYSGATLVSAGLLPLFGPVIDRFNLRVVSAAVGFAMIVALLVTSLAPSILILFLGILGLRLSGQGLMTQIGGVATSRFFGGRRGKALAITGIGFALGTAVFPLTVAFLIERFGWQQALVILAASVLFVFLSMSVGLLRRTDSFQHPPAISGGDGTTDPQRWRRRDVLRRPFFYFAIPLALLPPFYGTGLVIHLGRVVEHKGWDMTWVASCFVVSAVLGRLGSFCMGPLVDRFTARRLYPWVLVPYAAALTVLMSSTNPWAAPVWLGLGGLSFGLMGVAMGSLWAEVFGVHSLGAITSLASASGVFASALSPVLFGWLLDRGITVDQLVLSGVVLTGFVTLLAYLAPSPNRAAGPENG